MIKYIGSYEHSECGLACIAMILNYYGIDISLTELREEYGVPRGGYSIAQLLEILNKYEIQGRAIKNCNILNIRTIKEPFIAYWKSSHFVIIERVCKRYVKIIDPARGKISMSLEEFNKNFSNILIYFPLIVKKYNRKKKTDKTLLRIILKNKREITLSLIATFLLQLVTLYIPIYIQKTLDQYPNMNLYSQMLLSMFAIIVLYYSFSLIKVRIISLFQNKFDKELTSTVVGCLLKLPYKFFVNRGKGEIIFTINSNQYIRAILSNQMLSVFMDMIFLILYFVVMFNYSFELSIFTVLLGIILVIVSIINSKIIIKKNETQLTNITDVQNITGEIVNNIETLKAVGAEDDYYFKWEKAFNKQLDMEFEKAKINSILGNISITFQVTYSLVIYSIGMVIGKYNGLSVGTIVAFNTMGISFLSPLLSLANSYLQLSVVKIYINQLLDVICSKPEDAKHNLNISLQNGRIEIENLFFKYNYFSEYVLKNVSLTIGDCEKIAIVGKSGSGKSTLLMLLASMLKATAGKISVGNCNITDEQVNKNYYRKQIGIVLQKSMLFNGTIKENIEMGRCITKRELDTAVENADLDELIQSFYSKEETIISEDGSNISGGQKQRICIARAIIKNPKVILLDEPTSSLDNVSEGNIMEKLFQMDSTVIVVAHRLSNITKFDRIIVLKDGEIEAIGNHSELLKSSYTYNELYYQSC